MPRPILLIEDHPFDAELIRIALNRCSLPNDIIHFSDGASAVNFLNDIVATSKPISEPPALVLLDLDLPVLDGKEVLKKIRTTPGIDDLPVVVLSHSRDDQRLNEIAALGIASFLPKPSSIGRFVSEVQQLLSSMSFISKAEH